MKYGDPHLNVYSRSDVVENYVNERCLLPCEVYLFDKYVKSSDAILDIGVGGGRTAPYLFAKGAKYIGVDYSQAMVAACKRKFPALEFYCENACDLRRFEDASFDVAVFSWNGMDCIGTVEAREACLREVFRVLKPGGRFIFSSHNAKQLGWWPELYDASHFLTILRVFKSLYKSPRQCLSRLPSKAFWNGSGYARITAEGMSRTAFVSTPEFFKQMANKLGFIVAEVSNHLYPQEVPEYFVKSYNYVFLKP
jgi:SAM-dependent methyltransferase